jgi:hypothetical protein
MSYKPDFEDYKNECLKNISSLQDEFMNLYDINSYENWFYDHGIGAFHFKTDDGKNLYFKYTKVGSFSTKVNTWNWSWDNKSTPLRVSRSLEKVQAFGRVNNFNELTQGLFNGDEYTGWAMTAISARLLNAIGTYRVPEEHLFIYFIFTNELTQGEYDALKDKYIECDTHTSGTIAFVCQHLLNNDKHVGFHEAFESNPLIDTDEEYQAWCDECEKVRMKEGEWNDASMAFAQIKLVCDQCYFEIKKRNESESL